jgi:hypothetical protein
MVEILQASIEAVTLGTQAPAHKAGEGRGQVPSLLAERAQSDCARPMRAVEGSLGHSLQC